jgi:hypothetical protein
MFQTAHARLAVVASVLWIPAAALLAPAQNYGRNDFANFLPPLLLGWLMIWVGIYGVNWVMDAPGTATAGTGPQPTKRSFSAIPRPVYYALVLIAVVLIMGLPKALFRLLS